ncbi:MAG: LysR family transcriptional regulator [Pseudomonadales bacterium]
MNDSLRDWSDIRLFLAILDHGSLVAASEHLGLTQPTVGRRLSALEKRLDTPLFVRSGRRMQLTDSGAAILDSARRMEREMLAIERTVEVQSKGLCGEVTISATEGTGTEWLTPVLFEFHQRYPDIIVKVLIESRAVDLVHREADIALRLGRPTQPDLIARRLVTIEFGLYATQVYLDRAGPVTSTASLADHQLVGLDTARTRIEPAPDFLSRETIAGHYVYLTNSPAAQIGAVRAGFGIGVLSHRWAAMVPSLQRVLPDYTPAEVDLWLVTHEELRHSARIRAVSDFIAERIIADAELFATGTPQSS